MLENQLNEYLAWCTKYNLRPQDYENFHLYIMRGDMGFWFDELLPLIENNIITGNLANALLGI